MIEGRRVEYLEPEPEPVERCLTPTQRAAFIALWVAAALVWAVYGLLVWLS